MFNALFGNLFASRATAAAVVESSEASTQTTSQTTAATQTTDEIMAQALPETTPVAAVSAPETPVDVEMTNAAEKPKPGDTSLDWVIVDPSEEADKCGAKSEVVAAPAELATPAPDNDVLLGSFFEKNESEPAARAETAAPVLPPETWLITPLPCLTSITMSQRSIVDNDPLENLLIEHPSMSVFVPSESAAPLAATAAANSATAVDSDDDDQLTLLPLFYPNQYDQQNEDDVELKVSVSPKSLGKQSRKERRQLGKRVAEKRKESTEESASTGTTVSLSPPVMRKKEAKKNKKSASKSVSNKENMQVKTLLLNEFKKAVAASSVSQQRCDSDALLNKNSMKRSNRNATFASARNANIRQRKYHKLQQPIFSTNSQQF